MTIDYGGGFFYSSRLPSILAKTLPPSAMGFGWRGAGAALHNLSNVFFITDIKILKGLALIDG